MGDLGPDISIIYLASAWPEQGQKAFLYGRKSPHETCQAGPVWAAVTWVEELGSCPRSGPAVMHASQLGAGLLLI